MSSRNRFSPTSLGSATVILAGVLAGALQASSAPSSRQAAGIPLCPGLTVVTAIAGHGGDYESIKTVESMDAVQVHLKYSAEVPNLDPLIKGPPLRKIDLNRIVLVRDLESASGYQQVFLERSADTIPETTSIGTSTAVLRALKARGESAFSISSAYSGVEIGADRNVSPSYYSYLQSMTLKRIGSSDTPVSVLVNDVSIQLPAVVAQGEFAGDKSEFTFLDDERNPITLAYRIGIGQIKPLTEDQKATCDKYKDAPQFANFLGIHCNLPNGGDRDMLRVIKISYRCAMPGTPAGRGAAAANAPGGGSAPAGAGGPGASSALEQALEQSGKADVYSIYFSFNSDVIREESEPTLKEIGDVLRRHPDWKLRVAGHTDGIGTDQANLDLSKRRAAQVKAALVSRYGIAADRLTTDGFGKSQPKDTNETLEGRAHNRRVELVRS